MNGSTAIVLSASANAQSAAAQAAANEAAKTACVAMMRDYTHAAAGVQEMQQYAECVGRLHPSTDYGPILLFFAWAVLIGMSIGLAYGIRVWWRESEIFPLIALPFFGAIGGPLFGALLLVCGYAIKGVM